MVKVVGAYITPDGNKVRMAHPKDMPAYLRRKLAERYYQILLSAAFPEFKITIRQKGAEEFDEVEHSGQLSGNSEGASAGA